MAPSSSPVPPPVVKNSFIVCFSKNFNNVMHKLSKKFDFTVTLSYCPFMSNV